jgi:PPOX class probable F420-dependent enzyme
MPNEPKPDRPHMPGYGVEQSPKGMLPWSWAAERLARSRNYWVATTRANGHPHSMAVWGLWLDNTFMFSSAATSQKARNLARDPHVVITTENADEAVVVEGEASINEDQQLKRRFVDEYKTKYNWEMTGDEGPLFVVLPERAFAFIGTQDNPAGSFTNTATRWTFVRTP